MKAYPAYRDCGLPWLPVIPSHWAVHRLGTICNKKNRIAKTTDNILICSNKGTVFPRNENTLGLISDKEDAYQGVEEGDLLIHGMDTWHGAIAVSKYSGKCTKVVHVCESSQNKSFVAYFLQMLAIQNVYKAISNGVRGNTSDFRSWNKARIIIIAYPPTVEEQNTIVAYLDKKCAEIDELVSRRQAIIERLKELKQAIIAEAVTKGLNPEVPMKESGIAWLGEIPLHWSLERLQWHLCEIKETNSPIKTNRVLSLTNKKGVIPYEEKGNQGNKAKASHDEYKLAYPDTLVMNSMNVIIGSVGICNYFGCVSPVYYIFKTVGETMLSFVNYVFQTTRFQKELRRHAKGILEIRLRLSSSDILKQLVAFPPLTEQNAIVTYLDKKCAEIDELVARQEQIIEKLKELKTSTIAHVVTGKVDVRNTI